MSERRTHSPKRQRDNLPLPQPCAQSNRVKHAFHELVCRPIAASDNEDCSLVRLVLAVAVTLEDEFAPNTACVVDCLGYVYVVIDVQGVKEGEDAVLDDCVLACCMITSCEWRRRVGGRI